MFEDLEGNRGTLGIESCVGARLSCMLYNAHVMLSLGSPSLFMLCSVMYVVFKQMCKCVLVPMQTKATNASLCQPKATPLHSWPRLYPHVMLHLM